MAHALKVALKAPKTKKSSAAEKSPAELAVQRRRAAIDRTRGVLTRLAPGRSLSNELIAERRAEARAEDRAEAKAAPARRRSAKR